MHSEKGLPPFTPAQHFQFLLPEFLGYLWGCSISVSIYYYVSIYQWSKVLLPSLGVWQGCTVPSVQESWRAYSHHTASLSGGQWSITWAISWPLDSLGAERNDLGALFPWWALPSHQLQCIHFPLKSQSCCMQYAVQSDAGSRNTGMLTNDERKDFQRLESQESICGIHRMDPSLFLSWIQFRKEVLLLSGLPESITSRTLTSTKKARRCELVFIVPSVNQRDQQVHGLTCKEVASFQQGTVKENSLTYAHPDGISQAQPSKASNPALGIQEACQGQDF